MIGLVISRASRLDRWSRAFVAAKGLTLSGWPVVAGTVLVWKFPKDAMEPLVTLTLLLFGLAAMLARYGPSMRRVEAYTFATVGLFSLAVAFGPWTSGPLNIVPAG